MGNLFLGVRAEVENNDRSGLYASFTYLIPKGFDSEEYLRTLDGDRGQRVDTRVRYNGFKLNVNAKYYFANTEYGDDFGLYGIMGLGLPLFTYKETILDDYDNELYTAPSGFKNDVYRESLLGLTMNFGLGSEVLIGDNPLFGEQKLLVPPTEAGGREVDIRIPASIHLTIGYRFNL